LLIGVGLSGRDDTDAVATLGVGYGYEQPLHPADGKKPILAVVLAQILLEQHQGIIEYATRCPEADLCFWRLASAFVSAHSNSSLSM
jgi:hypothetical protein